MDLKGDMEFETSKSGKNICRVYFENVDAPFWFVSEIILQPSSKVVLGPADSQVADAVRSLISKPRFTEMGVSLVCLDSLEQLENAALSGILANKNTLLFLGETIPGEEISAIDLPHRLNLAQSPYFLIKEISDCRLPIGSTDKDVKIIPLSMLQFVDFKIVGGISENLDCVLLDDDMLIRMGWEYEAKQKNVRLKTFEFPDELMRNLKYVGFETKIYIDSVLGNGIKGEDVAKELFDKGYKKIYLATGFSESHFEDIPYILEVRGKNPPF
ncbi:MAG: hypothetical protein HQK54_10050 [Oligoflexales bacterium]|nr:hypothetical protein [Oligoflexales bacterium]